MAHLANLESKRRLASSKLEQTILTNRTMNILLKKRLNLIEIDRKRALRAVGRMQKEVQADLRAMKDEKFNLMLKYQMNKTATSGPVSLDLPAPPDDDFANDIEGELFTTGLINAPGVNSRMKRLENRRRILPDFDDDGEDEDNDDTGNDEHHEEPEDEVDHVTAEEKAKIRPHTAPHKILKTIENNKTPPHHAHNHADKAKAVVVMTSGVVSLIDEDADLTQIAEVKQAEDPQPNQGSTLPVPITGFGIHSQMRTRNGTPHSLPNNSPRRGAVSSRKEKKIDRKKSVQFSRHRESIVVVQDVFGDEEHEHPQPLKSRIGGKGSHSRLSVVKSKIESNEKEFLLRLRIQNQKLENEDVAKKVWDFIGKRPISMFTPKKIVPKKDDEDADVLSLSEENKIMEKFNAAANKTSQDT